MCSAKDRCEVDPEGIGEHLVAAAGDQNRPPLQLASVLQPGELPPGTQADLFNQTYRIVGASVTPANNCCAISFLLGLLA